MRIVRADRLLQLLLVLQRSGRMTASRLAQELEVSVRTIYRDVEALSAAGVPVFAESGPGGGVQLVDGYETRLTGLTAAEAGALGFSGLPAVADQLGLRAVLGMAQAKVDAALPAELRSRATRVRQRFHLDAPGWFDRAEAVPCLEPLSHAVWDERRVLLRYRRADRIVSRTVDPLGLVLKAGTWYLVGRAGRPSTVRTYRVSRVTAVRALPHGFDRPEDFDLATAWAAAQSSFARDLMRYEVRAQVPADQLWRLRHALPAPAGDEAGASAGPPDADGWCAVVIRSESEEVAHDELLRLGGHVRIVAPGALQTRMRATARTILAAHE